MNTNLPLQAQIHHHLPQLQQSLLAGGFTIGTGDILAIQNLLWALEQQQALPTDIKEYEVLLRPLLCRNLEQQKQFSQHFQAWTSYFSPNAAQADIPTKAEDVPTPAKTLSPTKLIFYGVLFILSLSLGLGIKNWLSQYPRLDDFTLNPSAIQQPQQPESSPAPEKVPEKPQDLIAPIPQPNIPPAPERFAWLRHSLLLILSFIALGLLIPWHKLLHAYISRVHGHKIPAYQGIDIKPLQQRLFVHLRPIGNKLRRHRDVPSRRLDITASLRYLLRHPDCEQLKYASVKRLPEYLVLIARENAKDQQSALFHTWMSQLENQGLLLEVYYFNHTPDYCYQAEYPQSRPQSLSRLYHSRPDRQLLIFAKAQHFFDPDGQLRPWVRDFLDTPRPVLFSLTPLENRDWREQQLSQWLWLLPANTQGLQMLADSQYLAAAQAENLPTPPRLDYAYALNAPTAAEFNRLLQDLYIYLGASGYQWLSACAVYPQLHWQLTLSLGVQLGYYSETNLHKLLSLPWFRQGQMPHWLRGQLIQHLRADERQAIAKALANSLHLSEQPTVDGFQLNIPNKRALYDESERREQLYLGFWAQNWAYQVPQAWGHLLRPHPLWQRLALIGISAVVAGLIWMWVSDQIKPIDPPKDYPYARFTLKAYEKLDAQGQPLPADAPEWFCVKDHVSGLVWEVKQSQGLHNTQDTYTWYNSDNRYNAGKPGTAQHDKKPLVDYQRTDPSIDTTYFPLTASDGYWSATPWAGRNSGAWLVHFGYGYDYNDDYDQQWRVRLVRGGQ